MPRQGGSAGLEPGGAVVLNREHAQLARLQRSAKKLGIDRVLSFGADAKSDARLIDVALHPDRLGRARQRPRRHRLQLGMPGRHMAMNSLAVLAAASLAGADLALAALSLSQIEPAVGRGARRALEVGNGEATLIDESYNANPASMAAALNIFGHAAVGPQAGAVAVLGDMLELGPTAPALSSRPTRSGRRGRRRTIWCIAAAR